MPVDNNAITPDRIRRSFADINRETYRLGKLQVRRYTVYAKDVAAGLQTEQRIVLDTFPSGTLIDHQYIAVEKPFEKLDDQGVTLEPAYTTAPVTDASTWTSTNTPISIDASIPVGTVTHCLSGTTTGFLVWNGVSVYSVKIVPVPSGSAPDPDLTNLTSGKIVIVLVLVALREPNDNDDANTSQFGIADGGASPVVTAKS